MEGLGAGGRARALMCIAGLPLLYVPKPHGASFNESRILSFGLFRNDEWIACFGPTGRDVPKFQVLIAYNGVSIEQDIWQQVRHVEVKPAPNDFESLCARAPCSDIRMTVILDRAPVAD